MAFHHLNQETLCTLERKEINGRRYYVTPSGKHLPSVTTFLSHFKGNSLKQWEDRVGKDEAQRIKTRASIRGTKFHTLMERCLSNHDFKTIMSEEEVMPDMRVAFNNMRPTLDRINNIHHLETMLYSETIGLAGQVDCIGEFDGIPSVIDFKTSLKPKKEEWIQGYFEQCTCYSLMYEEMTGIKCKQIVVLISVDDEDEPQIFIKDRKDYFDSLINKINTFRRETEFS